MPRNQRRRRPHEVQIDLNEIIVEANQGLIWAIKGDSCPSLQHVKISFLRTWDHDTEFYGFVAKTPNFEDQIEQVKQGMSESRQKAYLIGLYQSEFVH